MYVFPRYRRGVKNRYRRGMPVPEMMVKDLMFAFQEAQNFFANGFRHKTLLAYPHFPSRHSNIYALCRYMNMNITNKPDRAFDLAIYWEYATYRKEYEKLEAIAKTHRVINLYSRDISKATVDREFEKVFGYSTFVNPTRYEGAIVQKSNTNALHDGKVIQAPIEKPAPGYIYQLALDNLTADNRHKDIRVPIVAGQIPMVFLQYRSPDDRFSTAISGTLHEKDEILSETEQQNIIALCRKLQLEFGELDIIRHKPDGRLYVIDVNNTPSTRARLFSNRAFSPFLQRQAELFREAYGAG